MLRDKLTICIALVVLFSIFSISGFSEDVSDIQQKIDEVVEENIFETEEEIVIEYVSEEQEKINDADADWIVGETSISILSEEEKASLVGMLPRRSEEHAVSKAKNIYTAELPDQIDWRNKDGQNWMTPVKYQASCGSCWAFSVIGEMEAKYNINFNDPDLDLDLSEQDVVCSYWEGCKGGFMDYALDYIYSEGVVSEECFPYSATDDNCENADKCEEYYDDRYNIARGITDYDWVEDTEEAHKIALQKGPITVGMEVYDDFYDYTGGVYEHVYGDFNGYHAVVLVGYNDTGEYWIVKNSWSKDWGEDGYFRIKYGEILLYNSLEIIETDHDMDSEGDTTDNCPIDYNPSQSDTDEDGIGDVCDDDSDNDGILDEYDACPYTYGEKEDGCPRLILFDYTFFYELVIDDHIDIEVETTSEAFCEYEMFFFERYEDELIEEYVDSGNIGTDDRLIHNEVIEVFQESKYIDETYKVIITCRNLDEEETIDIYYLVNYQKPEIELLELESITVGPYKPIELNAKISDTNYLMSVVVIEDVNNKVSDNGLFLQSYPIMPNNILGHEFSLDDIELIYWTFGNSTHQETVSTEMNLETGHKNLTATLKINDEDYYSILMFNEINELIDIQFNSDPVPEEPYIIQTIKIQSMDENVFEEIESTEFLVEGDNFILQENRLPDGEYDITLLAFDANLFGFVTESIEFAVDSTSPSLEIAMKFSINEENKNTVDVYFTLSPGEEISCWYNLTMYNDQVTDESIITEFSSYTNEYIGEFTEEFSPEYTYEFTLNCIDRTNNPSKLKIVDIMNGLDEDDDNVIDMVDNCPSKYNPFPQLDTDKDGVGDACDSCKLIGNDIDNDDFVNQYGCLVLGVDVLVPEISFYSGIIVDTTFDFNLSTSLDSTCNYILKYDEDGVDYYEDEPEYEFEVWENGDFNLEDGVHYTSFSGLDDTTQTDGVYKMEVYCDPDYNDKDEIYDDELITLWERIFVTNPYPVIIEIISSGPYENVSILNPFMLEAKISDNDLKVYGFYTNTIDSFIHVLDEETEVELDITWDTSYYEITNRTHSIQVEPYKMDRIMIVDSKVKTKENDYTVSSHLEFHENGTLKNITYGGREIDFDDVEYILFEDTYFDHEEKKLQTISINITDISQLRLVRKLLEDGRYPIHVYGRDTHMVSKTLWIEVDNPELDTNLEFLGIRILDSDDYPEGFNKIIFMNQWTNQPIVEFFWNMTEGVPEFDNITVETSESTQGAQIAVNGLTMQTDQTKTIYMTNTTPTKTLCIIDKENANISEMSARCTATDESYIICDSTLRSGYNCTYTEGRLKIEGLHNSAILQFTQPAADDPYVPSGGGGPGGSYTAPKKNETDDEDNSLPVRKVTKDSSNEENPEEDSPETSGLTGFFSLADNPTAAVAGLVLVVAGLFLGYRYLKGKPKAKKRVKRTRKAVRLRSRK